MDDPIVSVVITTRDRPHLVSKAISSALAQTVEETEIIVVDDGSKEPLRLEVDDERVRIIRSETSVGVCSARNLAMDSANGYWMVFLDDDDELVPHMIETSLEAATNSVLEAPVAVISGMEIVDSNRRWVKTRLPVSLEKGRHYHLETIPGMRSLTVGNTLFAPRHVLRQIGGWDQATSPTEHSDLMLRLNQVCSIEAVRVATYQKTNHPGVQWHENLLARAQGMEQVLAKHRAVFALHRERQAHFLATMGMNYLKGGKWGRAILNTSRALRLNPRELDYYVWWVASLGGPPALNSFRKLRGLLGYRSRRTRNRLKQT